MVIAELLVCHHSDRMMRTPTLRALECFIAVAKELNFRRAAEKIPIAQAALSRQIHNLEEDVGARLILRDTHSVELTQAGQRYLTSAQRVMAELQRGAKDARSTASGQRGTLRIAFIGTLYDFMLPALLARYRKKHPDVDFELHEMNPTEQLNSLDGRAIDLAFCGMQPQLSGERFNFAIAGRFPLNLAVAKNHRLASRRSVKFSDLKHELLLFTAFENAPHFNPWILSLLHQNGIKPQVSAKAGRSSVVIQSVALGHGVAIFPQPVLARVMPDIACVPFSSTSPRYEASIVWRAREEEAIIHHFLTECGYLAES